MTMYDAILESANVPAVSLLNELGRRRKAIFRKGNVHIADAGLVQRLGTKNGVSTFDLVKCIVHF